MRTTLCSITCVLAAAAGSGSAHGAFVGGDTAAAAAYQNGWQNLDDGATTGNPDAFGDWFLNDGTHLTGDSTNVAGGAGGDINTDGKAFLLRSTDGQFTDAFRFLDPAGLSVGQSFSIDLAVNFRGGFKGIDLRGLDNQNIFNFNVGNDDYAVSQTETGNGSIGDAYSPNTVFNLTFDQTAVDGGTWTITRSGAISDVESGTYTGVARSIHLYNGGQSGSDPSNDLYANNLQIIPEPSALALLGLCGLAVLARRN